MDTKNISQPEDTAALLMLLAIGNQEIEEKKLRETEEVFAELEEMDLQ
ncbi:hypothetical protein HU762_16460 [Pseudomonas sp. SWRI92]|nr:hypothetical protein [Pseudomonas sp. SWRI92]MBC3375546.1 hypothetical protein [Pseudomonas sp. SWRI92]